MMFECHVSFCCWFTAETKRKLIPRDHQHASCNFYDLLFIIICVDGAFNPAPPGMHKPSAGAYPGVDRLSPIPLGRLVGNARARSHVLGHLCVESWRPEHWKWCFYYMYASSSSMHV